MAFSWETEGAGKKKGFSWEREDNKTYADTLENRIGNYETRFNAIGADIPPPKDDKSYLLKALDIIDRPRNAIVNAIQDKVTGENSGWQGFKEGFTGKEHAYMSDLLDPNMNKYARGGLGFFGDVLLDPLTYLTVGTGAAAKAAIKEGGKAAIKGGGNNYLKFMGQDLVDLTSAGQKLGASSLGRATQPLRQGVADTFSPIFNTRHVMGKGKMSPEELSSIQGVVDDIAYLPQHIKGQQQIAMDEIKQAWQGVTSKAAEEATRLIESPNPHSIPENLFTDVVEKLYPRVMEQITAPAESRKSIVNYIYNHFDGQISKNEIRRMGDIALREMAQDIAGERRKDLMGILRREGKKSGYDIDLRYRLETDPIYRADYERLRKASGLDGQPINFKRSPQQFADQTKINDFVDRALTSSRAQFERLPIRPVGAEEASILKNILGKDVSDFVHEISNKDLIHAIKRHSDNSIEVKRGQVAITPEDLKKIPEIISKYDAIKPGSVSSTGRKSVIYEKRVNGNIIYVEVVHQGRKTLLGKTMWKEPSRNLMTKNVPQYTSEIEPGLNPSVSSLTSGITKGNGGQGENFKRGIQPLEIQAINYGLGKNGSIVHAPEALRKPEFAAANLMTKTLSGSEVIPYTGKGFGGIYGFSDGRRVYLNANSKQPMLYIAGHELVHNIESANPETFARLSQIIREHVADNAGLNQHYAKMGYAAKDIPKELTADALAESMLEPTFWARVRQQAPELIKPMLDVLDKIINTFKQQAGKDMSITPYLKEVETMRNRLADEYRGYLADMKTGKIQVPGEVAAKQTALKMDNVTPEGLKAAEIARRLTEETAAKDIAAGVEFSFRDNYIKHLYKEDTTAQALWRKYTGSMKPNSKASFQKERKFDTYKDFEEWAAKTEGVNLTPIYDARVLTAVREMEGVYKRASNAMFNKISGAGEFVVRDAYDKAGKRMVPSDWVEIPGVRQLRGKAVHPEVARHLDRFNSVFVSDAGMKNAATMWNSVQNIWKGWVTASVPFHLRNAMGNFYNNFLAGVVNPNLYAMAAGVEWGIPGKFKLHEMEWTSQELLNEFRKQGLEGFGQFHGETVKSLTRQAEEAFGTDRWSVNPLSRDFAVTKASRGIGDKIETNAKLAHFIDKLAKGNTPEQAAESVRKYLFDYSDLTKTEQKIKMFVPFYTWTRKNLPLQMQSMITQPGKPGAVNKLVQNMQNTSDIKDEEMPEWMRNEIAIPLYVAPNGTQYYLSPNLPLSNLSIFGGGDTLRSFAGMLSPMAKAPIEIAMDKQFFTRQPIEKYPGATANYAGFELPAKTAYFLNQLGSIPRNIASIAEDISPTVKEESLVPPNPERSALTDITMGSLIRGINPERQKILNMLERERQLADHRRYMEEVLGIEVPTMQEIEKQRKKTGWGR